MKKVYVKVEVGLIIQADEGIGINDMLENMDYNFVSQTEEANIVDTEIRNWEITDSK